MNVPCSFIIVVTFIILLNAFIVTIYVEENKKYIDAYILFIIK